jgi:hypothetical protein
MNGQELLDTKIHQIWLKDTRDYRESEHVYKPWGHYTWPDSEYGYSIALKTASYLTQQGYDVKLVTSIVTNVL